jgi:hypothetical protein
MRFAWARLKPLTLLVVAACGDAQPAPSSADEPEERAVRPASAVPLAATLPVASETNDAVCPSGMVLVEGDYCPEVVHRCKRWLDPEGRYRNFRCAEYEQPAVCRSPKKHMRFCIDRDEYTAPGESLPSNHQSLTSASRTCGALGKRVCRESEYNFACEGEEMRPYPYGFSRDASACNADRTDLFTAGGGSLRDHRARSGEYSRCESPFGVRDLAGNLEEMVAMDGPGLRPAMKGAYWQPGRNHCRAAQTAHDAHYNGIETGFRCCSDSLAEEPR